MPDSPAGRAGIEVGDTIESLEGRPVSTWSLTDVEGLLEGSPVGRRVTIGLRRGEVAKTVTIVLREVLK